MAEQKKKKAAENSSAKDTSAAIDKPARGKGKKSDASDRAMPKVGKNEVGGGTPGGRKH